MTRVVIRLVRLALAVVVVAALTGCGTRVTVNGTYADVWAATNAVVESAARDRDTEHGAPKSFASKGTIEAVSRGPLGRGELHYWLTVEPVAKQGAIDEPADRKVTVLVRQLDRSPDAADETEAEPSVAAHRRGDIERAIASEIVRKIEGE